MVAERTLSKNTMLRKRYRVIFTSNACQQSVLRQREPKEANAARARLRSHAVESGCAKRAGYSYASQRRVYNGSR